MSRINYRERCPTCNTEVRSGSESPPPFQPVPLTVEIRADLWRYFGEKYNDGSWPSLPPESVRINIGKDAGPSRYPFHSRLPGLAHSRRSVMTTWTCVHKDKGGHRLFTKAEDTTRFWVADASGGTPDKTDDGALEISPDTDSVVLHASHGYLVARVVVKKASGKEFSVFLSCGCALFLARAWKLPVRIQDPTLTEAVHCVVAAT